MIALRPHHALCMQFFRGKGYSEPFTHRMTAYCGMNRETEVRLVFGTDDLCAVCPNRRGTVCVSEEKIVRYDAAVAALCGFRPGAVLSLGNFLRLGAEQVILPDQMPCTDCEWRNICGPLSEKARETAAKR